MDGFQWVIYIFENLLCIYFPIVQPIKARKAKLKKITEKNEISEEYMIEGS